MYPPLCQGEGLDVAPPPVRGGHGSSSHIPLIEEGGAYFCPSLPCLPLSSPHSHGSSSQVPPWVISRSLPPSRGDTGAHPVSPRGGMGTRPMSPPGRSYAPPLDRGHGSSSHVPLKRGGRRGVSPCPSP